MTWIKKIPAHKLKASSLVEVLTAMVIILVVMGMATLIFVKMIHNRQDTRLQLQQQLLTIAQMVKREQTFSDRDFILPDSVHVSLHTEPYHADTLLWLIELSAFRRAETKPLATHREIVLKRNDHETP